MRTRHLIAEENHAAYPDLAEELEHVADKLERDPTLAREKYGDFICDIASKAQRWKMTPAQMKAASRALESRSKLDDVPDTGKRRVGISGEVLSLKSTETKFGVQLKMLVKTRMVNGRDVTCKLYGTVPSDISTDIVEGDKVNFTATIDRSDKDPKFGFFGRPSGAKLEGEECGGCGYCSNCTPGPITKASEVIRDVKSRKCGYIAYSPSGEELICVGNHKPSSGEPHDYLPYKEVAALVGRTDDHDDLDDLLDELPTQPFKEPARPTYTYTCARCGPGGMAQPEYLFDALGNPPWEYDSDGEDAKACECCDELIDAWGAGPVESIRRCDGMCAGPEKGRLREPF